MVVGVDGGLSTDLSMGKTAVLLLAGPVRFSEGCDCPVTGTGTVQCHISHFFRTDEAGHGAGEQKSCFSCKAWL